MGVVDGGMFGRKPGKVEGGVRGSNMVGMQNEIKNELKRKIIKVDFCGFLLLGSFFFSNSRKG